MSPFYFYLLINFLLQGSVLLNVEVWDEDGVFTGYDDKKAVLKYTFDPSNSKAGEAWKNVNLDDSLVSEGLLDVYIKLEFFKT